MLRHRTDWKFPESSRSPAPHITSPILKSSQNHSVNLIVKNAFVHFISDIIDLQSISLKVDDKDKLLVNIFSKKKKGSFVTAGVKTER